MTKHVRTLLYVLQQAVTPAKITTNNRKDNTNLAQDQPFYLKIYFSAICCNL